MKKKLNVLVLFGGRSSEHEVSRFSAAAVIKHLDDTKYSTYKIGITKTGRWLLTIAEINEIEDGSWESRIDNKDVSISITSKIKGIIILEETSYKNIEIDCIFPVLHGTQGEDGSVQGLFELTGINYVGPDVYASASCMDKVITKLLIAHTDIAQATYYVLHRKDFILDSVGELNKVEKTLCFKYPFFVKPAREGSSVGVSKVFDKEQLKLAIEKALIYDSKVLIEEGINGREIEVAVLGNSEPRASVVGEIFAANEFYDYNAKYENSGSKTEIVKDLDENKIKEIQNTALKVYKAMGCRGLSRVDLFLEQSGQIVFNEINTLPGFTKSSMFPVLWGNSGIVFNKVLDYLIKLAMEN